MFEKSWFETECQSDLDDLSVKLEVFEQCLCDNFQSHEHQIRHENKSKQEDMLCYWRPAQKHQERINSINEGRESCLTLHDLERCEGSVYHNVHGLVCSVSLLTITLSLHGFS